MKLVHSSLDYQGISLNNYFLHLIFKTPSPRKGTELPSSHICNENIQDYTIIIHLQGLGVVLNTESIKTTINNSKRTCYKF